MLSSWCMARSPRAKKRVRTRATRSPPRSRACQLARPKCQRRPSHSWRSVAGAPPTGPTGPRATGGPRPRRRGPGGGQRRRQGYWRGAARRGPGGARETGAGLSAPRPPCGRAGRPGRPGRERSPATAPRRPAPRPGRRLRPRPGPGRPGPGRRAVRGAFGAAAAGAASGAGLGGRARDAGRPGALLMDTTLFLTESRTAELRYALG